MVAHSVSILYVQHSLASPSMKNADSTHLTAFLASRNITSIDMSYCTRSLISSESRVHKLETVLPYYKFCRGARYNTYDVLSTREEIGNRHKKKRRGGKENKNKYNHPSTSQRQGERRRVFLTNALDSKAAQQPQRLHRVLKLTNWLWSSSPASRQHARPLVVYF